MNVKRQKRYIGIFLVKEYVMNIYGITVVTLTIPDEVSGRLENVTATTKLFRSKSKMEIYLEELDLTDNDEVFTFEEEV